MFFPLGIPVVRGEVGHGYHRLFSRLFFPPVLPLRSLNVHVILVTFQAAETISVTRRGDGCHQTDTGFDCHASYDAAGCLQLQMQEEDTCVGNESADLHGIRHAISPQFRTLRSFGTRSHHGLR